MTLPWRRMTLHLSQIGLTDGLTFISLLLINQISSYNGTLCAHVLNRKVRIGP